MNQCPFLLAPEDVTKPESAQPDQTTTTESPIKRWKPQIITGEKVLTARIGPTGGEKGYKAITGMLSSYLFYKDRSIILKLKANHPGVLLGTSTISLFPRCMLREEKLIHSLLKEVVLRFKSY